MGRFTSSLLLLLNPRERADFIIHYADMHFHAHKFVLHHHSAYFRTYFQMLSTPSASSSTLSPSDSSPSSNSSQPCNHPTIAHCIHLPQQTTLVEQTPVMAGDFELFLDHLYFSSHYCYPPCLPKTEVHLDADAPPISLTFPPITSLDWSHKSPQLRSAETSRSDHEYDESLLTLAHYFDCAAMMAQCEAVLLTEVEWNLKRKSSSYTVSQCVKWLQCADVYQLTMLKKAYIRLMAADKDLLEREEYEEEKKRWDKGLVMQVLEARVKSEGKGPSKQGRKKVRRQE